MNEFKTIQKYFLPLSNANKAAGSLQDDVATISFNNKKELIISKDLIAQDVHFSLNDGAYNIACKLLKSNLSDLAAGGAKPLYYLLGFSKNNHVDEKFLAEFCRGLKDVGNQFKLCLIGGDSIKVKDKLCFSITIFGEITKKKTLGRNNAKNGDLIFVSGDIGDAFLGLNILQQKISCPNKIHKKYLVERHLQPTPRVDLGINLANKDFSRSAIDISDGLLADLLHICKASILDAIVQQSSIPLSKAAQFCLSKNKQVSFGQLFSGGEDYELIFAVNKNNRQKVENLAKRIGVKISCIGHFQKTKSQPRIHLLDEENKEIKITQYGWQHY
jgi:thiamine-monophosphate kinase